ncbi:hypothetical protein AC623_04080 [Bacillus sp. FJAT-27231]|nr:hypothetical protein AC623_04080 [Bacillus sp. FJAT-27231]
MIVLKKRTWHWLDTFLFIIRAVWMAFIGYNVMLLYSDMLHKAVLMLAFVCMFTVPYFFYRPGYMKFEKYIALEFLLSGSMFFFMVLEFKEVGLDVFEIMIFPLVTIAFVSQSAPFIWLSPFIAFAILLTGTVMGQFYQNLDVIIELADTFIFYVFGFVLGRIAITSLHRKELIESMEEKNMIIKQYAKKIEELTIIEERHRVSQDLHDTVGHIFTSVITSLDALPFLIKANRQEAKMYIEDITALARSGLEDVRNSIYELSLAEENAPLNTRCRQLIEEFIKHTGTKVNFGIEGIERDAGELAKSTFIRCLQESLTNAKRHGQATDVTVRLEHANEQTILEVKDNGIGFDELAPGFGLRSMKDRMITVGGTLQIESKKGQGTRITCVIPLQKEKAAANLFTK